MSSLRVGTDQLAGPRPSRIIRSAGGFLEEAINAAGTREHMRFHRRSAADWATTDFAAEPYARSVGYLATVRSRKQLEQPSETVDRGHIFSPRRGTISQPRARQCEACEP